MFARAALSSLRFGVAPAGCCSRVEDQPVANRRQCIGSGARSRQEFRQSGKDQSAMSLNDGRANRFRACLNKESLNAVSAD